MPVKMAITYDWFHNIAINQHWKQVKSPNELLLIASAPKKEYCFLGYSTSRGTIPTVRFKNNSVVALRGGRIYYDTDDIVPEKKTRKKSTKTKPKRKSKATKRGTRK